MRVSAQRAKILGNCFRMVQAFSMSLPLILLNFYTLLSILVVDEENLDLSNLTNHLAEGINGKCNVQLGIRTYPRSNNI
jgi:hypothetical protein